MSNSISSNQLVQQQKRSPLIISKEISTLQQKTKQQLIDEILTLREKILRTDFINSNALRGPPTNRSEGNRLALEAWRLLQYQEEAIRRLARERDVTMDFLSARLLFVESRLRQEQKNIEAVMERKERIIEDQRRQIQYLLQQRHQHPGDPAHQSQCVGLPATRDLRQSRRRLSRRFSLALEECDGGSKMSRASPCYASSDEAQDTQVKTSIDSSVNDCSSRRRRVRSMMELNSLGHQDNDNSDDAKQRHWPGQDMITKVWIENIPPPPPTSPPASDESSRNSDSLDSGVSAAESDDFETRSEGNLYMGGRRRVIAATTPKHRSDYSDVYTLPRRKSFDEYSSIRKHTNNEHDVDNKYSTTKSAAPVDTKYYKNLEKNEPRSFNRCFGTNHRSVTKPKDVKYRKLWKIRRVVSSVS